MNLPDGTRLTYVVKHETWFWKTATIPAGVENPIGINVQASAETDDHMLAWGFSVDEHNLGAALGSGTRELQIHMYSEAWPAFVQMPEFFAGLAGITDSPHDTLPCLVDVQTLLDGLGAVDVTPRTEPTRV